MQAQLSTIAFFILILVGKILHLQYKNPLLMFG